MSEVKIRHRHDAKKVKEQQVLFDDIQLELIDTGGLEKDLQEDANVFLLNNLMMSVQFFENYERDIRRLRETWFKELSLDSHHKKCFFADSLFRLSGASVKFSPRHGANKNSEAPLHPFRVYVSSDNVEAAFDPSALGRKSLKVWPVYQFTVRRDEKFEKSGCINLVEFATIKESNQGKFAPIKRNANSFQPREAPERNSIYIQNKSNLDLKSSRRFTKTEMSIGFLNRDLNLRSHGKRCSVKFSFTPDTTIPVNGFYKFDDPETRLKPKMIYDLRMNSTPATSHEIPELCYQYEEIRNTTRRTNLAACFRTQRILNAAAYKGYFCDLLIEKLAQSLNLDSDAVGESTILEEFITVNERGVQYCITPVITITDCNNFVAVSRFQAEEKPEDLVWPSGYMQRIMKILPCNAVPTWHSCLSMENPNYEKSWKLVFPKTEEFLLLHMMHAHIRCYFFVLLIYKSFIEPEINSASLGPKHLMHLLFWKVHRNFLAWPDDRPADTLLSYLKTLYKKLQNKYLPDFLITSRNLFATSLQKDLHMAQSLIKKIIENPVPYMIRAIGNLRLRDDFYPTFDHSQLNKILIGPPPPEKKKQLKKQKRKKVHFLDEEQLWTKKIIKQIEVEKKAEKQEEAARVSVDSVNVNTMLTFDPADSDKCNQILQMFTSHFLRMGRKSMEYNFLSHGLMYLLQTGKLLELMAARGTKREYLIEARQQINGLKQCFYEKIRQQLSKLPGKPKQFPLESQKRDENLDEPETREKGKETETEQQENQEKVSPNGDNDEEVIIKL